MNAKTNLIRNVEITTKTFYKDFLQNLELSFQEEHFNQKIESSYYVGKCCMCIYFESESLPGHGNALKLVELIEVQFSRKKN